MILVILTAVLAVCGAAKLDRSYLPPITAKTAGGSPGSLLAPNVDGLPSGSYTNDAQGVVVDAASPGTRTTGVEPTGLGGPRASYGSTDSKVGDAAFTGSLTGFGGPSGISSRIAPGFGSIIGVDENAKGPSIRIAPGFASEIASDDPDDNTRASTLKFANDVGSENYSYGFETDNGISIGENGVAADGIKAHGEYSYKGDDGQVYSVKYTADKDGYKPYGSHLPTPPPIPDEILKSLEKNAKEEAAGIVDDGTYDAQKYNDEGDYSSNNGGDNNNRPSVNVGDTSSGGSYVSHTNKANSNFGINSPSNFGIKNFNTHGTNQGSFQYSTQNRFGVQPEQLKGSDVGSSASAITSTADNFSNQGSVQASLPGSSHGNSAYSSAVTTGSGSASAFASSGPITPDFKNEYLPPNYGSAGHPGLEKTGSDSSTGVTYSGLTAVNPIDSSNSASATANGQDASAQAVATSAPSFGTLNSNQVANPSQSAFGSNIYTQNTQSQINIVESTGQHHGINTQEPVSASVLAQKPSFPTRFGQTQTTFSNTNSYSSGVQPVPPSGGFQSAVSPTKVPDTELTTPFESIASPDVIKPSFPAINSFGSGNTDFQSAFPTPSQPSSYQTAQSVTGQYNNAQSSQSNLALTGTNDASFASSSPKPALSQQQGSDSSYYYNQPAQPFNTPTSSQNSGFSATAGSSQFSANRQPNIPVNSLSVQGSKYTNTPNIGPVTPTASSQSGQYQGSTDSSYYNGITQATISPFPSASPTSASQFGSQSSQFGSKPTSQFGQSSSQTQFGSAGSQQTFSQKPVTQFGQKPIVQSQTQYGQHSSSQIDSTQSPSQQGTIYEYNKPTYYKETTSTSEQVTSTQTDSQSKPSQTSFVSQSNQFGNQQSKPFGSSSQGSSTQQSLTQSSTFGQKPSSSPQTSSKFHQTQFNKPTIQSGSNIQQTQFGTQFGQGSFSSPTIGSTGQQNQGTVYEYNKPASSLATDKTTSTTSSASHFSQESTSAVGNQDQNTQFGKKPLGSSLTSSTYQQTQTVQGSSFGLKPTIQFGQKHQTNQAGFGNSQVGSTFQQTQTFGSSSGSQFDQKPQTTQGTSHTSSTTPKDQSVQTNQFAQKPSFTQTQFGSSTESRFGQKQQSAQGSGYTSSTGQTTEFGKKPFGSTQIGSSFQQTTFGSQPTSQLGQKPSTNAFGQTQFGSSSGPYQSQGYKTQSTQGSGFSSTGQYTQFGTKPGNTQTIPSTQQSQTVQGSAFGSQQSNKQKPQINQGASNSQFGSSFQQSQFGSSFESKFGQKPQSVDTVSTTITQTKPFGAQSTQGFQQGTQFGSASGSQFGKNPQTSQGSTFASSFASQGQSQSGYTTQTGAGIQSQTGTSFPSRFGEKPSQGSNTFSQNTQFGQKPFGGTTFQQTQFSQKPQSAQGTTFGSSASKGQLTQTTQFGQTPVSSSLNIGSSYPQTQFGSSSGSYFAQKPQTSFGQKPSTLQTGSSYQQNSFGSSTFTTTTSAPSKSQINQFSKPTFGSTQTASKFGSSFGSQFGQQSQSSQSTGQNSGSVSQTTTSFGQKPFGSSQTGSSFQQPAFGSSTEFQSGQKPLTNQGSYFTSGTTSKGQTVQTSQFGQKPFGSQSQFGSATGSQISANPTTTITPTGSGYQQTQFGSSSSQFSKKPFGSAQSTGSSFSQTQFGTVAGQKPVGSFSQYGTKPFGSQSAQNSKFGSSTGSQFNQNTDSKGQYVQSTQLGQQSFSSQTTGSSSSQPGLSAGSQFSQKPQSTFGTISSTIPDIKPISQFDKKPFGSQTTQQQTQFGTSTGSQYSSQGQSGQTFSSKFGQRPQATTGAQTSIFSQSSQSQFGTQAKKPFGNTQTPFQTQFGSTGVQKPQGSASAFASSSGSFGSPQTSQSSNYQNTQFGVAGTQTQKPLGSSLTQQYTHTSSRFGTQPQKPFGSPQANFQQSQPNGALKPFGSQGSTLQIGQSADQKTQGSVHTTVTGISSQASSQSFGSAASYDGYNYQKPQNTFNTVTRFGEQAQNEDQKTQPTQTSFASQDSSLQLSDESSEYFSTPSPLGVSDQTQSTGFSQFGVQPTKPTAFNSPLTQTSQYHGQPGSVPIITPKPGTKVSFEQLQSAVSNSQFGVQPTQGAFVTSQQPSQTSGPLFGLASKPNTFGSIQSTSSPSTFGLSSTQDSSNQESVVSTVQNPINGAGINEQSQNSFVGTVEEFGGPRDPPKYDDKTGYHY